MPTKLNVSEILMFNSSHEIKSEVVNRMDESRKFQPLLLACIQREFWVIDGNHRLEKNVQDGNSECDVILIPNKLLLKFCQPFMKRSTSRGLQKQMKDIKDILGICS